MTRVFAFLLMVLLSCAPREHSGNDSGNYAKNRANLENLELLINGFLYPGAYRMDICMEYSMPLNWLYLTDHYYPVFHADQKQYSYIILGDSTMDYSSRYPGFLGPETQSVAVYANKLCDMITQLPAINTLSPVAIVMGTPGGNDVLDGIPHIDFTQRNLFTILKQQFPSAKLVVLGIPALEHGRMNTIRNTINSWAATSLSEIYPPEQSCFVDPAIATGNPALPGMLFDEIHYSPAGAMAVKDEISAICNVNF